MRYTMAKRLTLRQRLIVLRARIRLELIERRWLPCPICNDPDSNQIKGEL